ncbi:MAG: hypothetical protein GTO14_09280 [Anaerolineales bacterium]|nr:hypothetical protein [Anaerolineales bacterium]
MRRSICWIILCSMLLPIHGCGRTPTIPPDDSPNTLETAVAATMSAILSTPPTIRNELTSEPCPIPEGSPISLDLTASASIPSEVLAYLNAGGAIATLQDAIWSLKMFPAEGIDLAQKDFTGDSLQDLAITILDPHTREGVSGFLYFYTCTGKDYSLKYASPDLEEFGPPILHTAQDLTGDGIPDLLIRREACGAHTCFAHVELLLWNGTTLENRLEGPTDDLPSPFLDFRTPDSDGMHKIMITATGINSVGAGPFRPYTRTWSWDSVAQRFLISQETIEPSSFRIHVLHDADRAAEGGDHTTALKLYNQVVEDEALNDWIAGEEGRLTLSAYAMFRRILSHLRLNQPEQARQAYDILHAAYSEGTPGFGYAEMGRVFWSKYMETGDVNEACLAAQTHATHDETEILDPLYYGYANLVYTAAEICPLTR